MNPFQKLNPFQKILLYSFLGGLVAIIGSSILTLMDIVNPYILLEEIFARAQITYEYDFETFGLLLKIWTTGALLPIAGENLFLTPFFVESLLPLVLLIIIGFILGYILKFPDGVSASILTIFMIMGITMIFAIIVPHSLPSTGLSPSDLANLKGLTVEFIFLTIFIPPNWLIGSLITFGSCIGASIAGAVLFPLILGQVKKKPTKSKAPKAKRKK